MKKITFIVFCLLIVATATYSYIYAGEPDTAPTVHIDNIRLMPDGGFAVLYPKDTPLPPGAEQAAEAVVLAATEYQSINQRIGALEAELNRVNARRVALLAEVNNQAAELGRLRGALTRGLQASSIEEFREEMSILVQLSNSVTEARKQNE